MSGYGPSSRDQRAGDRERIMAGRERVAAARREQIEATRKRNRRRGRRHLAIGAAVALAAIIYFPIMEWGSQHTVTFTVQSLDDQSTGSGHQYLIFTTSGEVYKDTDAYFHLKTDSSNVWADFLKWGTGATVRCPVFGYRRTFPMTNYPDVLDGCTLVRQGTPVTHVSG